MKKIVYSPEIYTYQIDFNQHVSNIVYIQWMEVGRLKLLQKVGLDVHILMKKKVTPVLVETTISYKKPLYLGDNLTVEMWIVALNRASAELAFTFFRNGETVAAEGGQKGLFVNMDSGLPHRLTDVEKELFALYVA